jgi:class 3 adenylate cyclase/tetratricopeptide (TPR) repeat protein/energy-coupling factor transporter ATP-binding protein EcfA2
MSQRPPERRQLTIMFCDLVRSTELAEALDPEDYASLLIRYRKLCAEPVARLGGVLANVFGDGLMIYFGYPTASDSAAGHALRAALEIVAAVRAEETGDDTRDRAKMAVRIGIHTGVVVIADTLDDFSVEPMSIFGSAPSIAARLQAEAPPNGVVLSHATFQLVGDSVRCRELGVRHLRGVDKPVRIYEALAAAGAEPNAMRHVRPGFRLVGRRHEQARLADAWRGVEAGAGRAVLLIGEPGIGKSRIVEHFLALLRARHGRRLVAHGSAHARHSEFAPLADMMRHELLASRGQTEPEAAFDQLAARLAARHAPAEDTLAFASLLALDVPSHRRAELDQRRLNALTVRAVVRWLANEARREPLAIVVEDLHWADASTLDVVSKLAVAAPSLPLLVLLTTREDVATLPRDVERHVLRPLAPGDARSLLMLQAGASALPPSTRHAIIRRAAGNPLFIEELAKALDEQDGNDLEAGGQPPPMIPPTLRDTLTARLDRVGAHKVVAQVASILGQRFPVKLLEAVWEAPREALHDGLRALTRADLLTRAGIAVEPAYEFKHALIAEAAYASVLRRDRRRYHARAADALRDLFSRDVAFHPERVAWHLSGSEQCAAAFDAWLAAAKASSRRSAHAEAMSHLHYAEVELAKLDGGDAAAQAERRRDLKLASAPVLIARLGWAAPDVEHAYRAAFDACDQLAAAPEIRFEALRGLSNVYLLRGNLRQAQEICSQIHHIAVEAADQNLIVDAHRLPGVCSFLEGDYATAVEHFDTVILRYEPEKSRTATHQHGLQPIAITTAWRAWADWFRGDYETVSPRLDEAARLAGSHHFSRAYVLCFMASVAHFDGDADRAVKQGTVARRVADEHGFAYWQAWADVVTGWALVRRGEPAVGLDLLKGGIEGYAELGAAQMHGLWLCALAEAHLHAGEPAAARAASEAAIDQAARTGICFFLPEAYRLCGEACMALPSAHDAGRAAFVRAVQVAHRQSSPVLLVKAGAAALRHGAGQTVEACVRRTADDLRARSALSPTAAQALTRLHLVAPAGAAAHGRAVGPGRL